MEAAILYFGIALIVFELCMIIYICLVNFRYAHRMDRISKIMEKSGEHCSGYDSSPSHCYKSAQCSSTGDRGICSATGDRATGYFGYAIGGDYGTANIGDFYEHK